MSAAVVIAALVGLVVGALVGVSVMCMVFLGRSEAQEGPSE